MVFHPVRRLASSGLRALPGANAGLGMSITPIAKNTAVKAGTASVRYLAPGQPMQAEWDGQAATEGGYLGQTYVMRCVRIRAETVAQLPFRAWPTRRTRASGTRTLRCRSFSGLQARRLPVDRTSRPPRGRFGSTRSCSASSRARCAGRPSAHLVRVESLVQSSGCGRSCRAV